VNWFFGFLRDIKNITAYIAAEKINAGNK